MEFDTDVDLDFSEPPPPGKYHVSCTNVIEENDEGKMEVFFEVLEGTVKKMEGRVKKTTLNPTTKMIKFFHRLAITAGLTTQEELEKLKEKREPISYDFTKMVGRQFMVEITSEDNEDKTQTYERIQPWHIWSVNDPKCESWPKNAKMLKAGGYEVAAPAKSSSKKEEPDPDKVLENF